MRLGRTAALSGVLLTGVIVAVAWAPTIGVAGIAPSDVWHSILARAGAGASSLTAIEEGIVWEIRLPRVLTALFVGGGLAVCGAVLQALTRNPLADPYLLGLSSGASLGAVAVLVLNLGLALPLAAFAGGIVALLLTLTVAGGFGRATTDRTVLAGVAVSAACSAVTSLVIFWSATGDSYREILNWMLGSLAGSNWNGVGIAAGAFVLVGTPLLLASRTLDGFAFGDVAAASLGIRVERARWILLAGTALLTSALVSVSGAIGFVGLVIPHLVRLLAGVRHALVLPLSVLLGGLLMVCSDTVARFAFDPRELPVGIITALLGTPVFAILLTRRRWDR